MNTASLYGVADCSSIYWSRSTLIGYNGNMCIIVYDGSTNGNHLSASLAFGVACNVSCMKWSRSSHTAFSYNHWLSLGDGSPVDHYVFDIYGVAD